MRLFKVKRSSDPYVHVVCACARNLLPSYLSAYLILVSAPAGRYVTLPIATASTASAAAAAAAVFTRLLTMTLTARRQQSQRRQALTLTSSAQVTLTSRTQWHVLPHRLLLLAYFHH